MQVRPATLIIVASVAALFGFAGAASRSCAPTDDVALHASWATGPRAQVVRSENLPSASLQQ